MKIEVNRQARKNLIILVLLSVLAGIFNGVFGAGGGIVLVYAYRKLEGDARDVFASVVAATMIMSVSGAVSYYRGGFVDTAMLEKLVLPAALGGASGAALAHRVGGKWLRIFFSVLLVISGINLMK